jgi:hypothetical protein
VERLWVVTTGSNTTSDSRVRAVVRGTEELASLIAEAISSDAQCEAAPLLCSLDELAAASSFTATAWVNDRGTVMPRWVHRTMRQAVPPRAMSYGSQLMVSASAATKEEARRLVDECAGYLAAELLTGIPLDRVVRTFNERRSVEGGKR